MNVNRPSVWKLGLLMLRTSSPGNSCSLFQTQWNVSQMPDRCRNLPTTDRTMEYPTGGVVETESTKYRWNSCCGQENLLDFEAPRSPTILTLAFVHSGVSFLRVSHLQKRNKFKLHSPEKCLHATCIAHTHSPVMTNHPSEDCGRSQIVGPMCKLFCPQSINASPCDVSRLPAKQKISMFVKSFRADLLGGSWAIAFLQSHKMFHKRCHRFHRHQLKKLINFQPSKSTQQKPRRRFDNERKNTTTKKNRIKQTSITIQRANHSTIKHFRKNLTLITVWVQR